MIRIIGDNLLRLDFDVMLPLPNAEVVKDDFAGAELLINPRGEWTGIICTPVQWQAFLWESRWGLEFMSPSPARFNGERVLGYFNKEFTDWKLGCLLGDSTSPVFPWAASNDR